MAEALAAKAGIFVAGEAAKALIGVVACRSSEEAGIIALGSRTQRERLRQKSRRVQAFLEDLGNSNNQSSSQLVDQWLQSVKNVAYLADNIMDDYAYENIRKKLNPNNNFSSRILFGFQMYFKVRGILGEFDQLEKEARIIGLSRVELATNAITGGMMSTSAWNQAREHASHTAGFVGREKDVEVLLDMLCNPNDSDDDGLCTVAIVGMGGLGKTTLARHLYDHERIDAHFGNDNKHWISATDFKVRNFYNQLQAESDKSNRGWSNTDVIIRNLKDKMKERKMLVVLDDVWEDNGKLWDSFKCTLLGFGALPGSVILITTHKHVVAAKAGVESRHFLQPLSSDQSWAILEKGLIRSNVSRMEEIGRRIIEKCKGVPLAIKVMSSLLKSKQNSLSDWEKIERSEIWDLPQSQDEILPSLLLSFNHLRSPSLKQCFAYFGVIPKGNYVYKNELIGLWLSQGYLREDKVNSMEDIGEECIQILVNDSLLEEAESVETGYVLYKMHDLVHDLAVYVSRDEFTKEVKDLREKGGFRHLAFDSRKDTSFPAGQSVLTMLRTIDLSDTVSLPWDLLMHARYLRTLFLYGTGITKLPSEIERLKHLRYLDVSYNPIITLPDSISKLYQLETLILQECDYMSWKLPKVLNTLVSLRHISTTAPMFAWGGLQRLSNLQTLPYLWLDDGGDGWSIDELGELVGLRDEIRIKGLECVKDKEQARKAGLSRKAKVTKLTLSWDKERRGSICNDEDVLDGLEPHPNVS